MYTLSVNKSLLLLLLLLLITCIDIDVLLLSEPSRNLLQSSAGRINVHKISGDSSLELLQLDRNWSNET